MAWLMMLLPMQAGAQLATASVDPVGDSIAFAKMQRKLDRIRRTEHRPTVALVLSGGGAKGAGLQVHHQGIDVFHRGVQHPQGAGQAQIGHVVHEIRLAQKPRLP